MVVHLVQVHAVGKHLLDVSNLDGVTRRQIFTVNFDSRGVSIIEAPDKDLLDIELEVGASLPMQRLVFLDWVDR